MAEAARERVKLGTGSRNGRGARRGGHPEVEITRALRAEYLEIRASATSGRSRRPEVEIADERAETDAGKQRLVAVDVVDGKEHRLEALDAAVLLDVAAAGAGRVLGVHRKQAAEHHVAVDARRRRLAGRRRRRRTGDARPLPLLAPALRPRLLLATAVRRRRRPGRPRAGATSGGSRRRRRRRLGADGSDDDRRENDDDDERRHRTSTTTGLHPPPPRRLSAIRHVTLPAVSTLDQQSTLFASKVASGRFVSRQISQHQPSQSILRTIRTTRRLRQRLLTGIFTTAQDFDIVCADDRYVPAAVVVRSRRNISARDAS